MQTNLCHVQQELDAKSHLTRKKDAVALQKTIWDDRPAGLVGTTSTSPDPHTRIIKEGRFGTSCTMEKGTATHSNPYSTSKNRKT